MYTVLKPIFLSLAYIGIVIVLRKCINIYMYIFYFSFSIRAEK